jgi:hypothetical protein
MNTVVAHIQMSFLKGKRLSYQKMSLFTSGDPYKKIQKLSNSKMTDFARVLEIRLISGQAICNFMSFHAECVWQRSRNFLNMCFKNIESCLENFQCSRREEGRQNYSPVSCQAVSSIG